MPIISIIIPSFNHGRFLDKTLQSIDEQNIDSEIIILDGGSTDNTPEIISKWKHKINFYRSHKDNGQADAINEGLKHAKAPYVTWLNSDDWLLPNGMKRLLAVLDSNKSIPVVYGNTLDYIDSKNKYNITWVESFSERRLAIRCIISQPGALIRREFLDNIGGIDINLSMAFDYDLWWRLFQKYGEFVYINECIAVNRVHNMTKTNQNRIQHYREAMAVVKKYYGKIPIKWYIYSIYSVFYRAILNKIYSSS